MPISSDKFAILKFHLICVKAINEKWTMYVIVLENHVNLFRYFCNVKVSLHSCWSFERTIL